ncbi:MAG: hypothetical protein EKK56_04065 [Flavobacteriaceae bacterium]|nr:MAG: hypothetical protein EKK56_04065 [Flavobacteriaceae bacterium]
MKKLIFILIAFYTCTSFLSAQNNNFYYYKGNKVFLTIDKTKVNIVVNSQFDKNSISNLNIQDFQLINNNNTKTFDVNYNSEPTDMEFYQKLNALKSNPNIDYVNLFFKRGIGNQSISISNICYVKLKNQNDYNLLQTQVTAKGAQIIEQVPYMPLWYAIKINARNIYNTLTLTSQLWETNIFEDIDPGFLFDFSSDTETNSNNNLNNMQTTCTNDTNFSSLWGLYNSANPNIDINACDAWNITEGQGVTVAVVDNGIEKIHFDLAANIHPLSYNMNTGTSPSAIPDDFHGTHIAGTIAAIKNNNLQVVGVAPQAKIMDVSRSDLITPNYAAIHASGISWAWQNGADVINCSWGDQNGMFYTTFHATILENAILNAMILGRNEKGSIVIFGSGNRGGIDYPGNFHPDIITVGAINQTGQRVTSPINSAYGINLDVVAPGFDILSTSLQNSTYNTYGTSMATPHVGGIVALMLSVNPCLTRMQVANIIESTSQKVGGYAYSNITNRPNGVWNNEVGYGLVDAYAAVLAAQNIPMTNADLYIKDTANDSGIEPNTNTTIALNNSPDIWVRNQQDNIQTHQIPISSQPNYIYVKVKNRGCFVTTGGTTTNPDKVAIFLSTVNTSNSDPTSRMLNPTLIDSNYNLLNSQIIPSIQPNQEVILQFTWTPPVAWTPCCGTRITGVNILAKIISSQDPNYTAETSNIYYNIAQNNNIAAKNNISLTTNYNIIDGDYPEKIAIFNPNNYPMTYSIELAEIDQNEKQLFEESELSIEMDETIYNAWSNGGNTISNASNTANSKIKQVTGNNVLIDNLLLDGNQKGYVGIHFNFLTSELTNKTTYNYQVIQREKATNQIVGAATYTINKTPRQMFVAETVNEVLADINEPIVISANQISEPAIYNWYDTAGNLIFTGKDLSIATQVATKYKLEVIATTDGFKDYTEVDVTIKPSTINSISPNPASNEITIDYKINEANTAYLMIIGGYGTTSSSYNYILDSNNTQTTIDISNYQNGFYTVALVCNGQILDAKTLIKQ